MNVNQVVHIRDEFRSLLDAKKFTSINREASMTGLMGNETIEIVGASFIADEESIFGEVNWEWVLREEAWYHSKSLNVKDIPGGAPKVWAAVADKDGFINSNYGWCIWSHENTYPAYDKKYLLPQTDEQRQQYQKNLPSQYGFVVAELKKNPESRRAVMIYTRPSMWLEYNLAGRSDFMCTNTVQYLIRDGACHAVVQMRSNDAIFGFKGDRAWQRHVLELVSRDLNVEVGNIFWNVGSLHVYARHFYLIDPSTTRSPNMDQIYLSRRNLLTLLSKLDRARSGEATACTLIKSDNVHPTYPQTVGPCALTAVEDDQYYDRPAGTVLADDEPTVDTYLPEDVVKCLKLVAEHGTQLGLVARSAFLLGKYVK